MILIAAAIAPFALVAPWPLVLCAAERGVAQEEAEDVSLLWRGDALTMRDCL
jgi:hypothetical protein